MSYTQTSYLPAHEPLFVEPISDYPQLGWQNEISVHKTTTKNRREAQQLIQEQFEQQFGANLRDDMTDIYHGIDRSGECIAAFAANTSPDKFFSRHYIGDVITQLREVFGKGVNENNVVELGHLSAAKCHVLKNLAPAIADAFYAQGYRYLICTATRGLRVFFTRKRLAPVILGAAWEKQLPETQQGIWGQYYDHKPMVIAGDLNTAREQFSALSENTIGLG